MGYWYRTLFFVLLLTSPGANAQDEQAVYSPAKFPEWTACTQSSECIITHALCGGFTTVNRAHLASQQKRVSMLAPHISCRSVVDLFKTRSDYDAYYRKAASNLKCANKKCLIMEDPDPYLKDMYSPAARKACNSDSDCTIIGGSCCSWIPVNKRYAEKEASLLPPDPCDCIPGDMPFAKCIRGTCETFKRPEEVLSDSNGN
jgi:hypothetical protein